MGGADIADQSLVAGLVAGRFALRGRIRLTPEHCHISHISTATYATRVTWSAACQPGAL
jgi:hypothetical protein